MSKKIKQNSRWISGLSDFKKEFLQADGYYFGHNLDHRTDPRSLKLNPRSIKESGSIIEDLVKWSQITPCGEVIFYGDTGKIYKRDSSGVYRKLRQVNNSHGNGMSYFGEDGFIYYATDKGIGRYGPVCTSNPQFVDDFFGSQGGVPLNTNSLWLQRASSMYAYRADTTSLSITGDLSIEAQIHPLSLPTAGQSYVLASKWNENGNLRSYKLDITTQSNYFGDGSDGALTISADTTDAPIDSACTGTTGTTTLTATNASFAAGQVILIHQTQGTGAGTWMRNKITSYSAGTIQLDSALNATYGTGAQVLVMKQYTNVTVNSGKIWTVKSWNGTVGGILAFLANGTVTVTGTIKASGSTGACTTGGYDEFTATTTGGGFYGGYGIATDQITYQAQSGGGTVGPPVTQYTPNGNGGGGANHGGGGAAGGGGGGNGTAGENGNSNGQPVGQGGYSVGTVDLTTMQIGGGGGGAAWHNLSAGLKAGAGGSGGGIVFISGTNITVTGAINANGGAGGTSSSGVQTVGGGGGAGGSILLKTQAATLGTGVITATGGARGAGYPTASWGYGGAGGDGRINIDYYTSYTGTTTPTLNAVQDSSLGAADGYVLRLQLSADGTAVTTFSKTITPVIDTWQQVAVSFDSATTGDATKCQADFFYNAVSIGSSQTATQTIADNASEFFVGANKNSSGTATNFYDGYIDEVRVWSTTKTADDFISWINQQTLTNLPYLKGYWKFNGDYADATSNGNILTGSGSPTFVTDVPFPSPTTRLDIDQYATTTGNTYTTPTSISEGSTARKSFTPAKDPQKSIAVLVASVGTGNWTLTVHDSFNNEVATATLLGSQMAAGYMEFTFSTPWRPLINASYHFHLTSTVADGTVTTTNASDLETVSFRTYFQFLVEDTAWHPVAPMLQFLVFGNERYVGTYEATLYNPNTITLPAGYKVRCFGYYKEYLAIGTTKGASLTEQDAGRIYFWDGIASTYNFYIDVPEGGINALLGSKGKLWVWAGYQGDLLVYQGGDSADQIKRIPKVTPDKYTETYPAAVSMWRMLVRYGVSNSDSSEVDRTIYTWGSQNVRYPESLSNDFTISTGNSGSTVKIGFITTFNKKLLIGWQDNVSYGIDYIDDSNATYTTGTIEHMIEDDGAMYHEKEALQLVINFLPLVAGQTITPKFRIDRATDWIYGETVSATDETVSRTVMVSGNARYHEIEYGVDIATSISSSPTILGITIERDYLEEEERLG